MPFVLEAVDGSHVLQVDKPVMIVGRSSECDIQLDSRKISRRHCCLAEVNKRLAVRDLGSTNGIRINGAEVVEGSVQAGDTLTIGAHRYHVRWEEEEKQDDSAHVGRRPARPGAPPRPAGDSHGTDEDADGPKSPPLRPAPPRSAPPQRPPAKPRDWGLLEDSNEFEGLT